jgi:hypothetical protein
VKLDGMILRGTRSIRVKASWFMALAYLFCVLAPGAALAFGTGPAPCLAEQLPAGSEPMTEMHGGGMTHDHAAMHAHHHADAGSPEHGHDGKTEHGRDGKTMPGPCCAMMCVTALPADLPVIAKPAQPASICAIDHYREVEGRAPELLYRPPIS